MDSNQWEEQMRRQFPRAGLDKIIGRNNLRRSARLGVSVRPEYFVELPESRGMWHETAVEVEAGLDWGRRKAKLMAWIRRQMGRRLTCSERRCLEQYFLECTPYQEIASQTGETPATVMRHVRRAIHKLQAAAEEDGGRAVLGHGPSHRRRQ